MNQKVIFFDIDGTLFDLQHGVIDSTRRALRRLKRAGHLAFICTGRCMPMVDPELVALGFDGVVAACGCHITQGGRTVYLHTLPPEWTRQAVDQLRALHMIPVVEGPDAVYFDPEEYPPEVDVFSGLIQQMLGPRRLPIAGWEDRLTANKISAKRAPGCDEEAAFHLLSGRFDAIRHEGGTTELVPKGFCKAKGVELVLRHLGADRRDSFAFGDSNNDLDMLSYVQCGICMGNGTSRAKAAADYVTSPLLEDGIYNGLARFGLI